MSADPIKELTAALAGQSSSMDAMLNTVTRLQASMLAQQAALYALIATHPNPRAMFDEFATYIDRSAPEAGEAPDHQLREAMQRLQEKIRQAASRHSS